MNTTDILLIRIALKLGVITGSQRLLGLTTPHSPLGPEGALPRLAPCRPPPLGSRLVLLPPRHPLFVASPLGPPATARLPLPPWARWDSPGATLAWAPLVTLPFAKWGLPLAWCWFRWAVLPVSLPTALPPASVPCVGMRLRSKTPCATLPLWPPPRWMSDSPAATSPGRPSLSSAGSLPTAAAHRIGPPSLGRRFCPCPSPSPLLEGTDVGHCDLRPLPCASILLLRRFPF